MTATGTKAREQTRQFEGCFPPPSPCVCSGAGTPSCPPASSPHSTSESGCRPAANLSAFLWVPTGCPRECLQLNTPSEVLAEQNQAAVCATHPATADTLPCHAEPVTQRHEANSLCSGGSRGEACCGDPQGSGGPWESGGRERQTAGQKGPCRRERRAPATAGRRGSSVSESAGGEPGAPEAWSFPHLRGGNGHLRRLLETPASNMREVAEDLFSHT